ncbi:hypothetical protein [Dokdonella sp.]|uniref:hypothetical protein n=1 Tax=Dokdonella sp. TaxID=2291710 RepID=UPI00352750F3
MLEPTQFDVDEAWIVFRLNDAPIQTEQDGDLNCLALMDAASGFILGSELVAVRAVELSTIEARRLLKAGQSHRQQLPQTLLIPREQKADAVAAEATRQHIVVKRVPENELLVFIGEARQGFAERFGGRTQ